MAKFTPEQAVAVAAINQLINEWATELDINNGANIAGLVTEVCDYTVRGVARTSRAEVAKFYADRLASFPEGGVPVQRHALSNLRVTFNTVDDAAIGFTLVYYTTAGMSSGLKHADPAAVADVVMNVHREPDGDWLISMFNSGQIFVRTPS
jgi:hypothetical protein